MHIGIRTIRFALAGLLVTALAACGGLAPEQVDDQGKPEQGTIEVADGFFGETTTATVSESRKVAWVMAECSQGGEVVYRQYERVYEDNQVTLLLGPTPEWTGGDADCTAEKGVWGNNGSWRTYATTTFQVTDR